MDSDHSAEETFNLHDRNGQSCPICYQALDLAADARPVCILCNKKTCESCSIIQESPTFRYCCRCCKFLPFLPQTTIQQLQLETLTNLELTSKLSNMQDELAKGAEKFKALDQELECLEDKKYVIETMQYEVNENIKKIHDITLDIKTLNSENSELDILIQEKQDRIDYLNKELNKIKSEALESKLNSNTIPPECSDLFHENQELKEKLKEMESDHITYTQQMIDSLELLKAQLFKEKAEKTELKTEISIENEELEQVEAEKKRIIELQEELRITKRQLELMRSNRVEDKAFRSKKDSNNPELNKKKCQVF